MDDERWWKMRPATLSNIVGALLLERRDAVWPRLLGPMCSVVRPATSLGICDMGAVDRWLSDIGRDDLELEDVQVAVMSRKDVAAMLDGRDETAGRAIRGMLEAGVLARVKKGTRGMSSIYCVMPLPDPGEPNEGANNPTVT